jgi:hypothetical protein
MRGRTSRIALIIICLILISLSSTIGENARDLKKISEDHRYDSLGFAIFLAGSLRLASSLGKLYLLRISKFKKSSK